jgi:NADH dehydrogenase
MWTEDVAECVVRALRRNGNGSLRYELAGPETLSHADIVRTVLSAAGRSRPLVHVPTPIVSRALRGLERALGQSAPATWDEAELLETSMTAAAGAADAEALGVRPHPMGLVLGSDG